MQIDNEEATAASASPAGDAAGRRSSDAPAAIVDIRLRPIRAQDVGYVYSRWKEAIISAHPLVRRRDASMSARASLEPVFANVDGWTIAGGGTDGDVIVGCIYACRPAFASGVEITGGQSALHFVHVGPDFRGAGIARRLMQERGLQDGFVFTLMTPSSARWLEKGARYIPHLAPGVP